MADLHTSVVEVDIVYDQAVRLSPLVQRVTASNAMPFTGPGTNTYIVGRNTFSVIDPGPADSAHIDAIMQATGGRIEAIFATHAHNDHSPAAFPLAQLTGARMMGQVVAYTADVIDKTFKPDRSLEDGEVVVLDDGEVHLQAIETPGHLQQHLCFALQEEQTLFSGDHVMQGASVVIIPSHGGTMADYLDSLKKCQQRGFERIAPAHGHIMTEPDRVFQELYDHRVSREQKVITHLRALQQADLKTLGLLVYPEVHPRLIKATFMSLTAHLLKLKQEGLAGCTEGNSHSDKSALWCWLGDE